jgi:hypothetical protein
VIAMPAIVGEWKANVNENQRFAVSSAGEVTPKKGSTRQKYRLRPLTPAEKPEILKAYLDTFRREVQRYFPVPAGSPLEAFAKLTESYPAFELQPV